MREFNKHEKHIIALSTDQFEIYDCWEHGVYTIYKVYENFFCPQCFRAAPVLENAEELRQQFRSELQVKGLDYV